MNERAIEGGREKEREREITREKEVEHGGNKEREGEIRID